MYVINKKMPFHANCNMYEFPRWEGVFQVTVLFSFFSSSKHCMCASSQNHGTFLKHHELNSVLSCGHLGPKQTLSIPSYV